MMHEPGKSDRPIVPQNPANKERAKPLPAEWEEGRGLTKEKSGPTPQADRTQRRVGSNPEGLHQTLERIRQAARRDGCSCTGGRPFAVAARRAGSAWSE